MDFLTGSEEVEGIRCMSEASKVAMQALCLRTKCGTVIINHGKIIGRGYNAPPLDKEENRTCNLDLGPGKPKYDRTCCIHAEWRAIMDALRTHPDEIVGAKLYFTRIDQEGKVKKSGQPFCTVCSRLALDSGIAKFVLWHDQGIVEYPTHEYNRLSYRYTPLEENK